MTVSPPQPPPDGVRQVERAIRRAERAREKFDAELEGLIDDLHDAREAIRENPLPGEGSPDELDERRR